MKVIITRPRENGVHFANLLKKEDRPFEPILIPTLELKFKKVNIDIDKYKWVVFTSPRGVLGLYKNLNSEDFEKIKHKKIGAIGIETAKEFKKLFKKDVDVIPDKYTAEYLLESLKEHVKPYEKILIPTTPSARDLLCKNLNAEMIHVYSSEEPEYIKDKLSNLKNIIRSEEFNDRKVILTFTSGLTAKNFFKNADLELINMLKNHYIVSIGPITKKIVDECINQQITNDDHNENKSKNRHSYSLMPSHEYTIKGMIEVIKLLNDKYPK